MTAIVLVYQIKWTGVMLCWPHFETQVQFCGDWLFLVLLDQAFQCSTKRVSRYNQNHLGVQNLIVGNWLLSLQCVLLDLWRVTTPEWFPLIWYQILLVGQLIGGSNSTTMRRKLRGSSECGPYQNWLSAGSFVPSAHPQTHTCIHSGLGDYSVLFHSPNSNPHPSLAPDAL